MRGSREILTRQKNVNRFPFQDDFERSTNGLNNGWSGSTWIISEGTALNDPSLGSEIVVNGTFAADTDWTKGDDWTIAAGVAARASGAGASNVSQAVLTPGVWYRSIHEVVSLSGGAICALFGSQFTEANGEGVGVFLASNLADGTAAGVRATSGDTVATVDNISYKPLALSELITTIESGQSVVGVRASIIQPIYGAHAVGIVACLDDTADPANFVVGYMFRDGVNMRGVMAKCVTGVYTQLTDQGDTYEEGAYLEIRRSGNDFQLYYNGDTVGIAATINDAGILSNTRHGMFSAHSANQIVAFSIWDGS